MKVACIGNAVYDFTVSSDEFVVEGVRNSFKDAVFSAGGPASNAASVIARFGTDVDFYGRIGNDETGKFIYNRMKEENINLEHLYISDELMTPFSFVILNSSNDSRTILTVRANSDYSESKIGTSIFSDGYDYILTDGKYVEDTLKLIAKNPNAKTVIDAGRVNEGILNLCDKIDYIICSEDFANEVTGIELDDSYEKDALAYNKLKEKFKNASGIAITVGKRGYITEKDGVVVVNPAYDSKLPVVDTNCAGDIFHGCKAGRCYRG